MEKSRLVKARVAFAMSVNIDIRREGMRPTLTTSRMSAYLSDTGITIPRLVKAGVAILYYNTLYYTITYYHFNLTHIYMYVCIYIYIYIYCRL